MRSAALLLFLAAACGSDPKIVSVSLSPSTIAPGGTVTVSVEVENIDLHAVGSALRPAHGDEEGSTEGHLHAYLDSTETNPLAMTSCGSTTPITPSTSPR